MNKKTNETLTGLLENTGDMALKRRAKKIIEELNPNDGENILEVGCGDGFYLHLLSNLLIKLKLYGVDINQVALDEAKKNLKGKKVKLMHADLMKRLPFRSGTFDKIIMSEVAEHLPDDIKGLKEVRRVLKKDGILILTVPNHNYPLFWDPVNWILEHLFGTHIKSGFWSGLWNQHLRLYKPEEIKSSIKKAGFEIEKTESMTWWCLPFNHNLVNLVARGIYGGGFSKDFSSAVSKYKKDTDKPSIIKIAFWGVNVVDSLNDLYQPKNSGVGVLVKAVK